MPQNADEVQVICSILQCYLIPHHIVPTETRGLVDNELEIIRKETIVA
jgi:hypothetical protein